MKYPSISVIMYAYNEEKNLKRLFTSLKRQKYPKNKIEYILVDDGSTDNTYKLSKDFGARVIKVKTHDIELNKGIGMHKATKDLVYWLDADMEIVGNDFFDKLLRPFIDNQKIVGSFTNEFSLDGKKNKISSLLRFISYHPLQQDPLYAFFSPSIESTTVEKRKDYHLLKFVPGKIPAVGRIVYKRKELLSTKVGKMKPFIDMESVEIVTRAGYPYFAYVPKARIRHYHAESLKTLIGKRLRNLERDYLPNYDHKYFTWFNPKSKKDIVKIIFWIIYANLFVPELLNGVIKMIKHKDIAFLWQPVVAITTTDAIIWGFLTKPKGREIALNLIRNFFA